MARKQNLKLVITGASGLLGWHAGARVFARNCSARFRGEPEPFQLVTLDRAGFSNGDILSATLADADAVIHFAGVNRGPEHVVEEANPEIARTLVNGCRGAGVSPHIVYANSVHAGRDTVYGRSKQRAAEILAELGSRFTNMTLPHIFGECARPNYNNVTATLISQIISGKTPTVNPNGLVHLCHAGTVAELAIDAVQDVVTDTISPDTRSMTVPELLEKLSRFHRWYSANLYPDLDDPFDLALFNTYRSALYPDGFPRRLDNNMDARGSLFEAVKGGGGQTFCSWTNPGVTRGDHFHLNKVERFLVLEGSATIRIRRVLGGPVWEYPVTGDAPAVVDMPTLHTHSIENTGEKSLLTLFWANEVFDRDAPDTYSDPVQGG